jgi:hypothetical protein
MSKSISIDQSHAVIQALANNVNWGDLDSATLQKIITNPKEAGRLFTEFLKNGGNITGSKSKIITIDRSISFNPAKFIGKDWTIEEQDERSLVLNEIDLSKISLETILKEKGKVVNGEEKLKRLKESNVIRLDAQVFQTLWENKHLIPEAWKEKINGNMKYIFFNGTILRNSNGGRYVLCLYWNIGEWFWGCYWLACDRFVNNPSAVLTD